MIDIKPYNKLTEKDKNEIVQYYYEYKNVNMKNIAQICNVSLRSVPRVLKEFQINTRLKNRYTIKNEHYFDYIDTEFKAYILGFIYADGFVGTHDDFCMSLSDKVYDNYLILNRLKSEIGINIDIRHERHEHFGNYVFKFSNKQLVKALNENGVHTCKSINLCTLPCNIDTRLMNHFIRGFFDGDGTICTYYDNYDHRQRYCMEILGTKDFLDKIHSIICNECKIKQTKLHDVKNIDGLTRISHRGVQNLIKIREYLYKNATVYLTYKFERFYQIQPL